MSRLRLRKSLKSCWTGWRRETLIQSRTTEATLPLLQPKTCHQARWANKYGLFVYLRQQRARVPRPVRAHLCTGPPCRPVANRFSFEYTGPGSAIATLHRMVASSRGMVTAKVVSVTFMLGRAGSAEPRIAEGIYPGWCAAAAAQLNRRVDE